MAEDRDDDPLEMPESVHQPQRPSMRWRRKTEQELVKEDGRWRTHPLPPLLLAAAAAAALWALVRLPSLRYGWRGVSIVEALSEFPMVFVVCFVGACLLQLMGLRLRRYWTWETICTRCHTTSPHNSSGQCPCGGKLEDADLWTQEPTR